jgi:hypothetical protein
MAVIVAVPVSVIVIMAIIVSMAVVGRMNLARRQGSGKNLLVNLPHAHDGCGIVHRLERGCVTFCFFDAAAVAADGQEQKTGEQDQTASHGRMKLG